MEITLKIPFDDKDTAKEAAEASGGRLYWNGMNGGPKTWTYRGEKGSFPASLNQYRENPETRSDSFTPPKPVANRSQAYPSENQRPQERPAYRKEEPPSNVPQRDKTVLSIDYTYFQLAKQLGACYDPKEKYYYYNGSNLPLELRGFNPPPYSREERIQRMLDRKLPEAVKDSGKFEKRKYQMQGVAEIVKNHQAGLPGFLLADDLGLGKTVTAWIAAQKIADSLRKNKPCLKILVVGPLATLPAWRSTIQELGHGPDDILVLNYHRLKQLMELSDPKKAKSLKGVAKMGKAENFDIVLFDESQKLKNADAAVSKLGMKLSASAGYIIWMSATAGQRALELVYLASLLGARTNNKSSNILKDYENWCKQEDMGVSRGAYGKWIVEPEKQADSEKRIHEMIFKPDHNGVRGGIRRLARDISGWPERQVILHRTEIEGRDLEAYKKEWDSFIAWVKKGKSLSYAKEDRAKGLAELMRLRQKASLLKAPSNVDLILDLLDNNRNVAVSCFFHDSIDEITKGLAKSKVPVAVMHGKMANAERERQRLLYQQEKVKVILFTPEEGINLHAGEYGNTPRAQVNHDIRWSGIVMRQIDGRSHRNGQFAPVYWTVLGNTVEDRVAQVMIGKTESMDAINGDSSDLEQVNKILEKAGVL